MQTLAMIASLGLSGGLVVVGIVLRRGARATRSAVPGGARRDFFGDRTRVEALSVAKAPAAAPAPLAVAPESTGPPLHRAA
jgi:hypothetical protein